MSERSIISLVSNAQVVLNQTHSFSAGPLSNNAVESGNTDMYVYVRYGGGFTAAELINSFMAGTYIHMGNLVVINSRFLGWSIGEDSTRNRRWHGPGITWYDVLTNKITVDRSSVGNALYLVLNLVSGRAANRGSNLKNFVDVEKMVGPKPSDVDYSKSNQQQKSKNFQQQQPLPQNMGNNNQQILMNNTNQGMMNNDFSQPAQRKSTGGNSMWNQMIPQQSFMMNQQHINSPQQPNMMNDQQFQQQMNLQQQVQMINQMNPQQQQQMNPQQQIKMINQLNSQQQQQQMYGQMNPQQQTQMMNQMNIEQHNQMYGQMNQQQQLQMMNQMYPQQRQHLMNQLSSQVNMNQMNPQQQQMMMGNNTQQMMGQNNNNNQNYQQQYYGQR